MEEVYVIKLKGIPSANTSDSSNEDRDLLYEAILGLGVLHLILGLIAFLLGILGLVVEYNANYTGAGVWCSVVFLAAGVSAILSSRNRYNKVKLKCCFCLSILATAMSAIYLVVSCLGVAYFHSSRQDFNHMARVGSNTIVTAFAELIVATISMFASARALWPYIWFGGGAAGPRRQKIIVSANVLGGNAVDAKDVVRHISPNCVLSFRPSEDEQVKRVEEYVRSGYVWSAANSVDECSSYSDSSREEDRSQYVTTENWRNEVVSVLPQVIPYYPRDSTTSGC